MDIYTVLQTARYVLGENEAVNFFLALLVKSNVLLLLTLFLFYISFKSTAAFRHLVLCLGILGVACLPMLISVLPPLEIIIRNSSGIAGANPGFGSATIYSIINVWWWPVMGLYFGVFLSLLIFNAIALLNIARINLSAQRCTNKAVLAALHKIKLNSGAETDIRVFVHRDLQSPLSWGLWKPKILLPVSCSDWSDARLRQVLLHEVQHIYRLDWLTLLFGRYACALYWYNPLVWFAVNRLDTQAEFACDDAVLNAGNEDVEYAENLLVMAKEHAGELPAARNVIASAIARSHMGQRIIAVLSAGKNRNNNEIAGVARGVLVAFALVAVLASLRLVPETAATMELINVSLGPSVSVNSEPSLIQPAGKPNQALYEVSFNLPNLETVYVEALDPQSLTFDEPLAQRAGSVTVEQVSVVDSVASTRIEKLVEVSKAFPVYPENARQRGFEGFVELEYDMTATGKVVNPVIINSAPGRVFDQSALDAITANQYQAPTVNGVPVGIRGLRTRFIYLLKPDSG